MKIINEFKEFALKGNVMDMAVGVLIGGAFSGIVTALTTDFINPLIASVGGADIAGLIKLPWVDYTGMTLEEKTAMALNYGDFLTAVVNFLILAVILFILVKTVNKIKSIGHKKEEPAPTTKTCDFCKSEIHIEATVCPCCTSKLITAPGSDK